MKPYFQSRLTCLSLLAAIACENVGAVPYQPKSEDEIVEVLPARGAHWFEIKALQNRLKADPYDLSNNLTLVKRYIELGRAESDPRYFGYAEAVLAPWLSNGSPKAEVLTLRATLFQNRHDFPAALNDLNQALNLQPRLPQAWLTRALILEVQGHYAEALNSCLQFSQLDHSLKSKVCLNSTLSLSGQLEPAFNRLSQALDNAENEALPDKQWALITLAEMAERKEDPDAADRLYQQSLKLLPSNGYLLATYADFLHSQQRYAEVVDLLKDETRADGLLLRLTLAEQKLNLPQTPSHIDSLAARFAASRMRGDTTHQADEARFRLHLSNEPEAALILAKNNWAIQREPRDAKILLEAAVSVHAWQEAADALRFIAESQLQDARLQPLIVALQEVRP